MKIFVDSDVIFDVLEKREPFYNDSMKIFHLLFDSRCQGSTSPVILCNIFYLYSKKYSKPEARKKMAYLLRLFHITTMNSVVAKRAFYSQFDDFEDAMQYYSCVQEKIAVIISRNIQDYKNADIPVYTPMRFLENFFNTAKQ